MKDRYIYPAIMSFNEEDNVYIVNFPDLPDIFTYGDNIEDAIDSATDVLQLMLYEKEINKIHFNEASSISSLKLNKGEILAIIDVWMIPFRDKKANKSVNKTVTLPFWLNELSEKNDLNFSQILQSGLKSELGIKPNHLI